MKTENFILYLLTMATVTYLIRMVPLVLVKEKITNRFVRSFLRYIPYAVLSAMTVPACFFATDHIISAAVGFAAAFVLAYKNKSLITVAAGAVIGTLTIECIIKYILPLI